MKNKDQQLLEEAYLKVNEDFNSERQFRAFSQNLQSRGFKQVFDTGTNNGEIYVFLKPQTSELIFVEIDASKNFVDGYVLTTDSASKVVKHLDSTHYSGGVESLKDVLNSLDSIDQIFASEMFPLKSYQDIFAQIGKRDRVYAQA